MLNIFMARINDTKDKIDFLYKLKALYFKTKFIPIAMK